MRLSNCPLLLVKVWVHWECCTVVDCFHINSDLYTFINKHSAKQQIKMTQSLFSLVQFTFCWGFPSSSHYYWTHLLVCPLISLFSFCFSSQSTYLYFFPWLSASSLASDILSQSWAPPCWHPGRSPHHPRCSQRLKTLNTILLLHLHLIFFRPSLSPS